MKDLLLRYQDNRGLFPTLELKDNSRRTIDSIYLHTFVLEYLIDNHPQDCPREIQQGIDFIINQAIEDKSRLVWQWLKNPPTDQDYHPPDVDDTIRARLVIEKAKNKGFNIPREFREFDYQDFLNPLSNSEGAFMTYTRDHLICVCPEVNANILYSLLNINDGSNLGKGIGKYLENVVDSDYFSQDGFRKQSHYFLSPYFLAYVISKIVSIEPFAIPEKTIGQILEFIKNTLPANKLDEGWRSVIQKNLKVRTTIPEVVFEELPIFQAKSLKKRYCSPSATAVFCLEAFC